jgi:hypothetical protein
MSDERGMMKSLSRGGLEERPGSLSSADGVLTESILSMSIGLGVV